MTNIDADNNMAISRAMLPWEQQTDESMQAFAAFAIYRDMPSGERSIYKVAQECMKSPSLIGRWCRENGWRERARAYDQHLDALKRRKFEEELLEMAERHSRIAQLAQQKLIERLMELEPGEITPASIPGWLETAVRVERLSRGSNTEQVATVVKGTITHVDADDYYYDEVDRLAAVLATLAEAGLIAPPVRAVVVDPQSSSGADEVQPR